MTGRDESNSIRSGITRRRHNASIALAVFGSVLAIAACGSSSSPKNASPHDAFLAFSRCMRSHGVPDFPDPSQGGGIHLSESSGINPVSPSFKSAQANCQRQLPGGGPPSGHPSAQAKAQMLKISQCMRQHGVTGFPDPTLSPPTNPTGYSVILDRGGVVLAIPDTIEPDSPLFKEAAAACKFGAG